MGTIHSYKSEQATYHEGQPNQILSVTECKQYAVRFTDAQGKESMCLVLAFGKMEDGGLGVFRIASAVDMAEKLQQLPTHHIGQIRQAIYNYSGDAEIRMNPDISSKLADLDLENE